MNKNTLTKIILLTLFSAVGAASAPHRSHPFGSKRVEIPAGFSILTHTFIGSAIYQGPVGSVSPEGDVLGLSNLQSVPHPAYIHVLSGADEGMVSTILDVDSSAVVLETPLYVAPGDLVAIRKHTTIGELFPEVPGLTLVFYNVDGTQTLVEYFSGYGWFDYSTFELADDYFFRPGEGVPLSAPHPFTLTTVGAVTVHPVALEIGNSGFNILGTLNPVQGVRLDTLFAGAVIPNDDVEIYGEWAGTFQQLGRYVYEPAYVGWYNWDNLQASNHVEIDSGNAGVLTAQQPGYVTIPAAFVE
jgi:hypothetical protein